MGPRGFRRRGRRRGLIVGAAVGAGVANSRARSAAAADDSAAAPAEPAQSSIEEQLTEAQNLKNQNLITEAEYESKKKQILGI